MLAEHAELRLALIPVPSVFTGRNIRDRRRHRPTEVRAEPGHQPPMHDVGKRFRMFVADGVNHFGHQDRLFLVRETRVLG